MANTKAKQILRRPIFLFIVHIPGSPDLPYRGSICEVSPTGLNGSFPLKLTVVTLTVVPNKRSML